MTGTAEDGEARVLGESGIGLGELAEKELGAFGGSDEARVKAIGAEAEGGGGFVVSGASGHGFWGVRRALAS